LSGDGDLLQPLRDPSKLFADFVAVPASYVVFKDGSKCYAKNGSTGMIEYADADPVKVLEYAATSMASRGEKGVVYVKFPLSLKALARARRLSKDCGIQIVETRRRGVADVFAGGWGVVLNAPIYDPKDYDTTYDFPTLYGLKPDKARQLLRRALKVVEGDFLDVGAVIYLGGGEYSKSDTWYAGLRLMIEDLVDMGFKGFLISSYKYGYSPGDPAAQAPFNTNDYNSLVSEYTKLGKAIKGFEDYVVVGQRPPGFDWSKVPSNATFLQQLKQMWNDWLASKGYTPDDLKTLWSDYDPSTEPIGSVKLPMNDLANYPGTNDANLDADPRWYLFSQFVTEKLAQLYVDLGRACGVAVLPTDYMNEHGYRPILLGLLLKKLKEAGVEIYALGTEQAVTEAQARALWGDRYEPVSAPYLPVHVPTPIYALLYRRLDRGSFPTIWVLRDSVTYDSANDRLVPRTGEFYSLIWSYPTPRPHVTAVLRSVTPSAVFKPVARSVLVVMASHPSITPSPAVLDKVALLDIALADCDCVADADFEFLGVDIHRYDAVVLVYPVMIAAGGRPKLHSAFVSKFKEYLMKGGRVLLMVPADHVDYGWFDEHVRSQDTWLGGPIGFGDRYADFLNGEVLQCRRVLSLRGVGVGYSNATRVVNAYMGSDPLIATYTSNDWGYIGPSDLNVRSRVVSLAIDVGNRFIYASLHAQVDFMDIPEYVVKSMVRALKLVNAPLTMSEDGVVWYLNLPVAWKLPVTPDYRIKAYAWGGDLPVPSTARDVDLPSGTLGASNNPVQLHQMVFYRIPANTSVPAGRTRFKVYFSLAPRGASSPVVVAYYRNSGDVGKIYVHDVAPGGWTPPEWTYTNMYYIVIDNLTGASYTTAGEIYIAVFMPS
jgi:hypothetical protein